MFEIQTCIYRRISYKVVSDKEHYFKSAIRDVVPLAFAFEKHFQRRFSTT